MKNLSWLYYKGYYSDFNHWNNIKPSDENLKRSINTFFRQKNDVFLKAKLPDFKRVAIPEFKQRTFLLATSNPGLLLGSGYTHGIGAIGEFKIGFHIDYNTGLPIIPGSSVKGAIRSVFPLIKKDPDTGIYSFIGDNQHEIEKERVKAKWILALLENIESPDFLIDNIFPDENDIDESLEYFYALISEIFEGVKDISESDPKERYYSIYKRNIFFDAVPVRSDHTAELVYADDSITPHSDPLKNPMPLLFLKVLPKVTYEFSLKLSDSVIEPILTVDNIVLLFKKILLTTGIGAKTNVGYGQFYNVE